MLLLFSPTHKHRVSREKMVSLQVCLALLVAAVEWRGSLAGYDPLYPPESQVAYNNDTTMRHILFPSAPDVNEVDYEYFFNELNFDAINSRLLSGAADTLYLFDLDLNVVSSYSWPTDTINNASCFQTNTNPLYTCRNHIRVYQPFPSNQSLLLACGTQAESDPQCRTVTINNDVFGGDSAALVVTSGIISYYPEFSNFGEFVEADSNDQRYFSASFGSDNRNFLLSYQQLTPSDPLQTTQLFSDLRDDNWLKFPVTFVDYYRADYPAVFPATMAEHYQFYFVFLREKLQGAAADIIYSRVVRICRNDPGVNNHFSTFMKARIFCEREVPPGREFTGSIDFQYNEISSVAFNEDAGRYIETEDWNKRMYGAFTGPSIGPGGTAICVYPADNSNPSNGFNRGIFDIFRENLQVLGGGEMEHDFVECTSGGRNINDSQLIEIVQDIDQIGENPLLVINETVTQMAIDSVCVVTSDNQANCVNQDILFLGTDNGKILKVVFATTMSGPFDPIIAEEIQLDDELAVNRLSVQVASDMTKYLYVSTFSRIYRLPLERCARYEGDCSACIGSQDPYCVWNTGSKQCERSTLSATDDATGSVPNELKQNIHNGSVPGVCDRVQFSFNASSYSVSESESMVTVTVTSSASGAAASGLVEVYTENGTATGGMDFVESTQQVTFADGENTAMVTISLLSDSTYEGESEEFTVRLRSTGAGLIELTSPDMALITINEDDSVTIGFESTALIRMEAEGYVNITLQKTGSTLLESCVQITTAEGTALAGIDYLSTSEEVAFAPDEVEQRIVVPLVNNDITEATRTFSVSIAPLMRCTGVVTSPATNSATISIEDDDSITVQFDNSTYNVREGDVACVTLTVTKSGQTTRDFTLQLTATTGTAGSDDFDVSPRTVTLTASQSQATVCVNITDDAILENIERFTVTLTMSGSQAGLVIGERDIATVNILDNDSVTLEFAESSYSVSESSGYVEVTVMKQGESAVDVTVTLSTMNNTASAPGDYSAVESQCLTFSPSDSSLTYRILIVDDSVVENTETFQIRLDTTSSSQVLIGGTSVTTVSISDDDAVSIRFERSDYTVSEAAGTETVTLVKFGSSDVPLIVTLSTLSGSASPGDDYVALDNTAVTFEPSEQQQSMEVMIVNDGVFEDTENFSVAVSASSSQILTPSNVTTVTITDDEVVTIGFTSSEYTVVESAGSVSVSVEIDIFIAVPVTVRVATTNGQAAAPDDYTSVDSVLTFMPGGPTQQNISVSINSDNQLELPESFSLQLTRVGDDERVRVDQATTTVSITDDDSVTLEFAESSYSVSESSGYVEVTIVKQGESAVDVTVTLSTVNNSATAPGDYSAVESQCLTFSPSDSSLTYRVLIVDDNIVESFETFQLQLDATNPSQVLVGTISLTTISISDDDAVSIRFEKTDYRVVESAGTASLTLVRFGSSDVPLVVTLSTLSGSASPGDDYVALDNTAVTFEPSDQQQSVDVMIVNDGVFEDTESFSVAVSASSSQILTPSNVTTVTITDDELVTIGFASSDYTVVESVGSVSVNVEIDISVAVPVTVRVATTNGEATAPDDYTSVDSVLTFMPGGATQQNIPVSIVDDDAFELPEAFSLQLTRVGDDERVTVDQGTTTVSITDDDSVTLEFVQSSYSVSESSGYVEVTIMKQGESAVDVTVTLSTVNTTASPPGDYSAVESQCLTFSPSDSSLTHRILIVDDKVVENTESFELQLTQSNPMGVTIGISSATVSITDDDSVFIVFISDYTVSETVGAETVTLVKFGSSDVPLVVTLSTLSGSASPGDDYVALDNTAVTFEPSEQQQSVEVMIVNDGIFEETESFSVAVSASSPQILTPSNVTTVTITDDEVVTIGFVSSDYTVVESVGSVSVSVEIDIAIAVPVTVRVATTNGEATAPDDYTSVDSVLTFMPGGSTQQNIPVSIVDNDAFELPESFSLQLTRVGDDERVRVDQGTTTVSITDDDSITLEFAESSYSVSESSGYVEVTVMKQGESAVDVTVTLSTLNNTASAPGDYSAVESQCLTFSPSDSSLTYRILIVDDSVVENTESFELQLAQQNPMGVTIGRDSATLSITDDDTVFIVFISDYTVNEANGVESLVLVRFGSSDVPLVVTLSTLSGSASPGDDYVALDNTAVTFEPSEQQQSVDVMIVNDGIFEETESFSVAVSASSPQILTPSNVTAVTITDDEVVTIGFASSDYTVVESVGSVSVSVEIDISIAVPVTVRVATTNGEATAPGDYTPVDSILTFMPGGPTQQNIFVPINSDNQLELPESFSLHLTRVGDNQRLVLSPDFVTVSIADDDSTEAPETMATTIRVVNEITSSNQQTPNVGGLSGQSECELYGSFQIAIAVLVVLIAIILILLLVIGVMAFCLCRKRQVEKLPYSKSPTPDNVGATMSIHNKFYREDSTGSNLGTPMTFLAGPEFGSDHSPGSAAKVDLKASSIEGTNKENGTPISNEEATDSAPTVAAEGSDGHSATNAQKNNTAETEKVTQL